ncbi:MAG TPA: T9SS type A sorting domain-containing protein [Bacteroidia bacterium]|nr:T9SS type A sorting domain-containing protein [Bacteroidia bacterium]
MFTFAWPYGYHLTDTLRVQWNGTGPRRLILRRNGIAWSSYVPGWSSCEAYDTLEATTGPNHLTGPNSGCTAVTGNYAVTPDTGYTYLWTVTGGGTLTSGQGTPNATVNWAGSGRVKVVKNFNWCPITYTDSINFTVNPLPTPNLGPNTSFCQGSGFLLDAGPGNSYAWSTGATTRTILPNASGAYSVTVSNGIGCSGTSSVTLTMNASPAITTLPSNLSACVGANVILNPGVWSSYIWSTGATTQTINPTTAGVYAVTVTDANGCTSSASTTLTFNANPTPSLPPIQNACANTVVTLNPGLFSSYLWNTGATAQAIYPTTSGIYSVTVTASNGCTGTASTNLTIHPLPTPNLGPNLLVCQGTPTILNPGTFTSYSWSNGATTPTISPTASGNYTVTVTDANGCTGTDVVTVTFLPLPSFSLGNDSFVCADTSVLLSGPVGMGSYIWSTGATSNSITVTSGGTYLLTVTDGNGCTASDDIVLTGLTDCVFPGDANYDGVADNQDILVIGAYYGFAGLARPGATTQWYGQNVANWGGALPGNADPKHSDCNGDGIVQAVDTMAVTANYGQTHTKTTGTQSAGAVLHVIAAQDSMLPGGMATFEVHLGEIQNPVDSVYGIAFTIHYSTGPTANPGLRDIDYSGCWFAGNGSRLDFTRNFYPSGEVDVAAVRQDQVQQAGFGEVCRFSIQTDPNLAVAADPLRVWLTDVQLVDAQLAQHSVTTVGDSTIVTHNLTGTAGNAAIHPPRIFPNPANDVFQIVQMEAELREATLWDMNGRLILVQDLQDAPTGTISAGALSEGVYFLRISSSVGNYMQKLVIAR